MKVKYCVYKCFCCFGLLTIINNEEVKKSVEPCRDKISNFFNYQIEFLQCWLRLKCIFSILRDKCYQKPAFHKIILTHDCEWVGFLENGRNCLDTIDCFFDDGFNIDIVLTELCVICAEGFKFFSLINSNKKTEQK